MRKMYSKGQIKRIGKGYKHKLVFDSTWAIYAWLDAEKVTSLSDIPLGLYPAIGESTSLKAATLLIGAEPQLITVWTCNAEPTTLTDPTISDTLLD